MYGDFHLAERRVRLQVYRVRRQLESSWMKHFRRSDRMSGVEAKGVEEFRKTFDQTWERERQRLLFERM